MTTASSSDPAGSKAVYAVVSRRLMVLVWLTPLSKSSSAAVPEGISELWRFEREYVSHWTPIPSADTHSKTSFGYPGVLSVRPGLPRPPEASSGPCGPIMWSRGRAQPSPASGRARVHVRPAEVDTVREKDLKGWVAPSPPSIRMSTITVRPSASRAALCSFGPSCELGYQLALATMPRNVHAQPPSTERKATIEVACGYLRLPPHQTMAVCSSLLSGSVTWPVPWSRSEQANASQRMPWGRPANERFLPAGTRSTLAVMLPATKE